MDAALKPDERDGGIADMMNELGRRAKQAASELALAEAETKTRALAEMAKAVRTHTQVLLDANTKDLASAEAAGRAGPFLDRLKLDEVRIEAMAKGLEEIAALEDPVGDVMAEWARPNGLKIQRVRVPLGVIGIIYESRPNVTADAGGLSLKSGNAVILRCGSESQNSAQAIHACLIHGLKATGLPEAAIQIVSTSNREAVGLMLKGLDGAVDVIVPRGGKNLVARVQSDARIPVFSTLKGFVTSMWTAPPILKWRNRLSSTPRCDAQAFAARPKPCLWTRPARSPIWRR